MIQDRTVDLVINLPNKQTKHVKENYLIRRAAVDYGIGCISNLEVFFQQKNNFYILTLMNQFI